MQFHSLSNTVKENLVARAEEWPGVHCARPLLTGEEVEGTWFDRRREYSARLQGKEPEPREFASPEKVVLSQLPCWKHLSPEGYRSRIAEFVRSIEEMAAADRRESLIEPLGADGVRAQNPETRPRKLKKSPAPFVHVAAFPRGGGQAQGRRPERGVSNRELPTQVAVRGGLSGSRIAA